MISTDQLHTRLTDLVVRTERGNTIVRRNPRELPRRLRVLLLAIDGTHTVELYVQTLKGFGDISELLVELCSLGLVDLISTQEAAQQPVRSQQFSQLSELLDDSRFKSELTSDLMYGSTAPGSFDEMLRVAKIEVPDFVAPPPAPPPKPITPDVQKAQIDSLFDLLGAMRGERHNLKKQIAKMKRLRATAIQLDKENQRLFGYVFALSSLCVALLVALVVLVARG